MSKLLDQRQFRWWHRLRRMGPLVFTVGLGGLATTTVVILLHVVVAATLLGAPLRLATRSVLILAIVLGPICFVAFVMTWSLMERRYRTTLAHHCPRCGYALRGNTTGRCPECGASQADGDAGASRPAR